MTCFLLPVQVLFYFIDQLIIIVIIFYCLGATSAVHHVLCIAGATYCPGLHRRVYALPLFGEVTFSDRCGIRCKLTQYV